MSLLDIIEKGGLLLRDEKLYCPKCSSFLGIVDCRLPDPPGCDEPDCPAESGLEASSAVRGHIYQHLRGTHLTLRQAVKLGRTSGG